MRITIITISYNSRNTIEDTIKSIIGQEFDDLEYIVIDGGSTDGTVDIINKYSDRISKIIIEKDNGISDAFNKGITLATGELIGLINSDDFLCQNALNNISNMIEQNSYADVYYANCISFDEKENLNYIYRPTNSLKDMKLFLVISHPASFVRREAYKKYGLYSERYKCAMDFELFSKMYLSGAKFCYLDVNSTFFRLGGVSGKQLKRTCYESIEIATRNGIAEKKAKRWYIKIYIKQRILTVLKKMKLESVARHYIKRQESISGNIYWFR